MSMRHDYAVSYAGSLHNRGSLAIDTQCRRARHTVEDFDEVIRHYGPFLASRDSFFKAFGLWQKDGGLGTASSEASQGVLLPFGKKTDKAAPATERCPFPRCLLDSDHEGDHELAAETDELE